MPPMYGVTVEVADVRVAYKKRELINALRDRGTLIAYDSDKVDIVKADLGILDLIKEKEDKFAEPVCCFVTFTNNQVKEWCEEHLFEENRRQESWWKKTKTFLYYALLLNCCDCFTKAKKTHQNDDDAYHEMTFSHTGNDRGAGESSTKLVKGLHMTSFTLYGDLADS